MTPIRIQRKRTCRGCSTDKEETEFRGGRPTCRECERAACRVYGAANRKKRNARLSRWRQENPEKARAVDRRKSLRRNYGLTPEEADALLAANDGKCLICHDAEAVAIDHCHRTGRVRGGLCLSCNTFLGRVEANPAILNRMATYADVLLEIANEETVP